MLCPICSGPAADLHAYQRSRRSNAAETAKLAVKRALGALGLRPYTPEFHPLFARRRIWECSECGVGFMMPRIPANQLADYYMTQYWQSYRGSPQPSSGASSRGLNQVEYIKSFVNLSETFSFLEFGAGGAGLSAAIKSEFPGASGTIVEPSVHYAYPNHLDLYDCKTSLEEVDESFDLLVSSHSLEHVFDAKETVDQFEKLLKPGGYLFVEVPNCAAPYYWDYRHNHEPHTFFFGPQSFQKLFEDFITLAISTHGPDQSAVFDGRKSLTYEKREGADGFVLRGLFRV